jgi:RNA polymerase sigma factor (sigma-70 family)
MIEPIHPDRWVEQHVPMIFRTCRRNTPSEDSAWEAFQETFLVFSRRRDDLDHASDYGPWLQETARRCCLAVVRRECRQPITGVADMDSVAPTVNDGQIDAVFLTEATSVLREEIGQLSEEDQFLLRSLYADGMTHRDIASRLNCPAGSVHAKAEEARRRLRKRIERRGIVVGALLLLFLLQGNAEAGWAPSASAPRKLVWLRRIEWRPAVMAGMVIFATFVPAGFYWNVTMATNSRTADTSVEPLSGCGCGSDIASEPVEVIEVTASSDPAATGH